MSTVTLRIDEEKHERLRRVAAQKGVSLNRLMDELVTGALAQYDAETRFRAHSSTGSAEKGLKLLEELDRSFAVTAGE